MEAKFIAQAEASMDRLACRTEAFVNGLAGLILIHPHAFSYCLPSLLQVPPRLCGDEV